MAFHVRVTAKAKRDLDAVLGWLLSHEAGDTGQRWLQGLRTAIESLSDMPERCPLAPENAVFPFVIRQLLYGRRQHRYRVLFTVEGGDTVFVLHVRHGRQRNLTLH